MDPDRHPSKSKPNKEVSIRVLFPWSLSIYSERLSFDALGRMALVKWVAAIIQWYIARPNGSCCCCCCCFFDYFYQVYCRQSVSVPICILHFVQSQVLLMLTHGIWSDTLYNHQWWRCRLPHGKESGLATGALGVYRRKHSTVLTQSPTTHSERPHSHIRRWPAGL